MKHLPRAVVALALVLMVVRLVLACRLELAFDEAYYWTWAHNLSLSYFDHPPMVAWFVGAGITLAGDTEFGVRLLGPVALFAGTLLLMAAVRDFGGDRRAMALAGLFNELTVAAQAVGVIMTPDTPLLFFSILVLRILAAIVAGGPNWLWLALGAAGGMALLSKYTAILLALGIVIWLLTLPERRRMLATAWPWAGAVIAAVLFAPVVIWNYQNDWVSFAKQGARTTPDLELSLKTFGEYIGGQLGLLTPLLAISAWWALFITLRDAWRSPQDRNVLFSALSWPLLIYFTFYSFINDVQGNWALVTLPSTIAATGFVYSGLWAQSALDRRYFIAALALASVLSAGLLTYLFIPFDNGLGRRDATHRLSGNRELTAQIEKMARDNGIRTIGTTDYHVFSELSFYLPKDGPKPIQVLQRERFIGWDVPQSVRDDMPKGPLLMIVRGSARYYLSAYCRDPAMVAQIARMHRGVAVEQYEVYRTSGCNFRL